MTKLLFWVSIAAIVYTYIGYPAILWLLARARHRAVAKDRITPAVSVVIACHNEARNIEARIKNLLELDYPQDKLEIIIVSDGSTDATAELARAKLARAKLARRPGSARARVFAYEKQMGKATALNVGMEMANSEIVVFADARQRFEPSAIKELAANFADPDVGAVSGEMALDASNGSSVGEGVGLYWKYEKWIRKNESRFSSVVGATGAIYAIRRELWQPLPPATILDDVYTPMRIALGGRRVVFEEKALAYDVATESASREFSRKVRTLTGNYQLCHFMPRLLLPTGKLIFQFYSHKLMRLAVPIFLLLLLATNLIIAAQPSPDATSLFYDFSLAAQAAFYASVAAGAYLLKRNRRLRLLNVAYVFSVMNAAALVGLFYFVFGKRNIWAKTKG